MKMHFRLLILMLLGLLQGAFSTSLTAQIRAYTERGETVLLYPDGTWTYDRGSSYGEWQGWGRRSIDPNDSKVYIDRGSSGKSAELIIKGELVFTLKNGLLDNIQILDRFGQVLYDHKTGDATYTSGAEIRYDFDNRLIRYGRYDIKYRFSDDKPEKFGPYVIDYDFGSDRVKRIGSYIIEYDFFTDRIKRIGNVIIDFDRFHERIRSIKGSNPGMIITIF